MKYLNKSGLFALGLASLSAFAHVGPAYAEPVVMRIGLGAPESDARTVGLRMMEAYVEEKLPGQIDIEIYPNSTLVSQSRLLPALQRGNIDGALFAPQRFAGTTPVAAIFGTAFAFRDTDHLCAFIQSSEGADIMAAIEEGTGLKNLGIGYNGTRHVILRAVLNVTTPQQMNGLRIRVPGSKAWQTLGEALGASPTPVNYGEMYLAMQTGTVDGIESEPASVLALKINEVTREIVTTGHMVGTAALWTSDTFWDRLTDEEKAVMLEGGAIYARHISQYNAENEAGALDELEAQGIVITEPDRAAFQEYASEVYAASDLTETWPEGILATIQEMSAPETCSSF